MRIVHIIKNINGGAGIAGCRIHEALVIKGIDSYVFYLEGDSSDSRFLKFTPTKKNYLSIILNLISKLFNFQKEINFNIFGYREIEESPLLKSADCLHLHFINGFLNYPTFFKTFIKKKIVFTLHDLNFFLGLYYYPGDLPKSTNTIAYRLNLIFTKIKSSFINDNISFIAPSKWIFRESLNYIEPHRVFQISNYIKVSVRQVDLIDNKSKIKIFFLAEKLSNSRKGVGVLIDAINKIKLNKLDFICAGNSPINNDQITNLGFLNQASLKNIYKSCDLVIIPSIQENLSNIMLESLSNGTPVLCFDIGGFSDFVDHKSNGFLINDLSSDSLAESLIWISENISLLKNRNEIISDFKEKLNAKNVINRHIKLYET
jgi:glycosyltransferase involved in cell wall biosynthesis